MPGSRHTVIGPWVAYRLSSACSEAPSSTSDGPTFDGAAAAAPPAVCPVRPENSGTQLVAVAFPPSHASTASGQAQVRGPSGGCGAAR